ncbi:MAG: lysylphosphatidylglycerol synthase transmembrane domain-containing protein [Chloroflexota bacterium]|nr:lysylphosphatidylglycerol synthase transmembrane domain-containing protein [Chloroflexota bacterium]
MLKFLKKWRAALVGVGISLAVVILFAAQIELDDLTSALGAARLGWIVPSALAIVTGLAARAVRWRGLLGVPLPLVRAFHILNVAYFANAVLPLRLGELARAYLASRGTPAVAPLHALSSVIVERLLDLLAVLILLGLALAFAPLPDALRASALLFVPVTAVGFGVLIGLAANRAWTLRLTEAIASRLRLTRIDMVKLVGQILDGFAPLIQPRALFAAVLWTGIAWTFSVASGWLLMFAFYPAGDIGATLLFTAAASFAVAVPAVPGNLGTYEASVWVGLAAMGYGEPLATATAFAITIHGLNIVINALLGGIGLFAEGVSLGQLTRGVRALHTTP